MAYQHVYQSDYIADANFDIDQFIDLSLNDSSTTTIIKGLTINEILQEKQLSIIIMQITTHLLDNNKPLDKPAECVCCIKESVNLIHICECKSEIICHECFIKRYTRTIVNACQDYMYVHKNKGCINYMVLLSIIEKCVTCIICKNNICFKKFCSVYYQIPSTINSKPTFFPGEASQKKTKIECGREFRGTGVPSTINSKLTPSGREFRGTGVFGQITCAPPSCINYYMLQNKNIIELASGIVQASGFIATKQLTNIKSLPLLLEYGYTLDFNPASQILNIRIKREYLLSIYAQLDKELLDLQSRTPPVIIPEMEIQNYKKVCKIRLSTKQIAPAVFYAIYYKCIELGILYMDLSSRPTKYNFGKTYKFIYSWNNLCQQVNNLINLYIPEETEADHGLISILLVEINSIKLVF